VQAKGLYVLTSFCSRIGLQQYVLIRCVTSKQCTLQLTRNVLKPHFKRKISFFFWVVGYAPDLTHTPPHIVQSTSWNLVTPLCVDILYVHIKIATLVVVTDLIFVYTVG